MVIVDWGMEEESLKNVRLKYMMVILNCMLLVNTYI